MSQLQQQPSSILDFTFEHACITHTGLVRERNEDSYLCLPEQNLWIVADGMGGHDAGDFASQTIVEQASHFTSQSSLDASVLLLEENFLHSNELIQQRSSKFGKAVTIGSTVASLFAWHDLAFIMWAGDSRVYRLRDRHLVRLTEDHSFVEELVKMGKIDASQAEEHPAANVVLNAVGIEPSMTVDMDYEPIQEQDIFMLCSDGLYKDLSVETMMEILNKDQLDLQQMCQQLVDAALAEGGSDNCTVILVKALPGQA